MLASIKDSDEFKLLFTPDRIDQLVAINALFKNIIRYAGFECKSRCLQHPLRCQVMPERTGIDARNIIDAKTGIYHLLHCFGNNALTPVRLAQPIAELSAFAQHICLLEN